MCHFLNKEEFELYSPRCKNASVLGAVHYARLRRAAAGATGATNEKKAAVKYHLHSSEGEIYELNFALRARLQSHRKKNKPYKAKKHRCFTVPVVVQ